jgi:hypothetical protein
MRYNYQVTNIKCTENQFSWTLASGNSNTKTEYCTNMNGEGVFINKEPGWSAHQQTGLSQLSLSQSMTKTQIRYRIRKFHGLI